jgi:hypothetical protein
MKVTNTGQSEREHTRDTAGDHACLAIWGLQVATCKTRLQVLMTSNRSCPPKTIDRVHSVELQGGSSCWMFAAMEMSPIAYRGTRHRVSSGTARCHHCLCSHARAAHRRRREKRPDTLTSLGGRSSSISTVNLFFSTLCSQISLIILCTSLHLGSCIST